MRIEQQGDEGSDAESWCRLHLNELPQPLISLTLKCGEEKGFPFNRYLSDSDLLLRRRIAAHYELAEENVLLEAGADGGLRLCFQQFCRDPRGVWIPAPSYIGFRQIAEAVGCRLREYRLVDAELNLLEIETAIPADDPLVVCNPNNPFGHIERNLGRKLRDRTGFTVCDEAYGEFAGDSPAIEMIRENRANVVVIRTFSKAFGAAGIRLGYLLGSSATLKSLKKYQMPYPVSCFAIEAGLRLWSLLDQLDGVTSDARRRRQDLERNLKSIGFRIVQGSPNVTSFFSCLPPPPFEADILVSKLAEKRCQVHLVPGGSGPNLIRFNAGSNKENWTVFLRLRELMAS